MNLIFLNKNINFKEANKIDNINIINKNKFNISFKSKKKFNLKHLINKTCK